MNCLTEALGLALPGNGSLLATHADRELLFREAGRCVVALARRWYEQDDARVTPRSVANFKAFENAMALDIAMGGSTNTMLHLLANRAGSERSVHDGGHGSSLATDSESMQGCAQQPSISFGRCASRRWCDGDSR